MARGLVHLIIFVFPLVGIGGEKLDKLPSQSLSIPFEVGGQNIIDNGIPRVLTPPYQSENLKHNSRVLTSPYQSEYSKHSSRVLTPPYQSENSKHNFNHKRKDANSPVKTFIFQTPVPLQLIHKSTFTSGPVDETTFRRLERQNLPTRSNNNEITRNEIASSEYPDAGSQFQRRTILSSSHQARGNDLRREYFGQQKDDNDHRRGYFGLQNDLTPVTASIRGFIATPGNRIQKISGTPKEFLEKTVFKGNSVNLSDLQLPLRSSTSMTIIPAVVKAIPLLIQNQNSNFGSSYGSTAASSNEVSSVLSNDNAITNHIHDSIFRRFKRLPQNTLSRNNNYRFARNLRSQNSKSNALNKPNKLKIIIYSKTPSKEQPPHFWNKIFQRIPQLTKSTRDLSAVHANANPKRSQTANYFLNRFQTESPLSQTTPQISSQPNFSPTNQQIDVVDGSTANIEGLLDGNSFSDTSSQSLLTWANFNNKFNVDKN